MALYTAPSDVCIPLAEMHLEKIYIGLSFDWKFCKRAGRQTSDLIGRFINELEG